MKKIICIMLALLVVGSASFAQKAKGTKDSKPATKQEAPAGKAKEPQGTSKDTPKKTDKKLKKDGTPDMRHKENKEAAKPTQKLKKDGTPDMRYKENKEAAKKKKS
jgi:hypothetical protein